jgi:ATP-dependent Clp protease ATP-binding subunit ClpC
MQIVGLFIKRLSDRLLDRDMTIEVSESAKDRLIEIGWEPTLGARPLRRAVQHEIEDKLSEEILHGRLDAGDHIQVDFVDGEFVFETGRQAGRELPAAVGADAGDAEPVTA